MAAHLRQFQRLVAFVQPEVVVFLRVFPAVKELCQVMAMVKNTLVATVKHHRGMAMVRMAAHGIAVFANDRGFVCVRISLAR